MSVAERECSSLHRRTQIVAKGRIAAGLVEAVAADAGNYSLVAAAAVAVDFVELASTSSKDCYCQC